MLVPGCTDDEQDLRKTGEFIRSLGNVTKVEVLPYHSMGADKWKALGMDYRLDRTLPPSSEAVSMVLSILKQR